MQHTNKIPFVFLTAHAFSGSTLVSFLMGSHPDIATVGELTGPARRLDLRHYPCSCGALFQEDPFWNRVAETVCSYGVPYSLDNYLDTRFEVSLNRKIQRLRASSLRNTFLETWRDRFLFRFWPGHRQALANCARRNELFARAILEVTGKSIFLDTSKDPMRMHYLQLAPHIDLYVIHLTRDVRGVVHSITKRHPETAVSQAARSWLRREKNIQRHLKTIPPTRQIHIRYEEIATNTLETMNKLFAFLNVSSLEELGDFRKAEHHILGNKMRKRHSPEVKLDEGWRIALSKQQIKRINKVTGLPLGA